MANLKIYQIFLIFLLLSFSFIIYSPMLNAKFAFTDDHIMLTINEKPLPDISLSKAIAIFKCFNRGLYHPLVTLSFSLEKTIFGLVPEILHFDNIILHILNTFLIFLIFFKLSNSFWLSFIIMTLFTLHPTRTEVVCWISARKDLLYALFYLLSVLFYIRTYEKKKIVFFVILSALFYLLACFSKAMAITLPLVIILIDFYTKHFTEQRFKIYFFYIIVSLIFIAVTIKVHYFTDYVFTQVNDVHFIFNRFHNF